MWLMISENFTFCLQYHLVTHSLEDNQPPVSDRLGYGIKTNNKQTSFRSFGKSYHASISLQNHYKKQREPCLIIGCCRLNRRANWRFSWYSNPVSTGSVQSKHDRPERRAWNQGGRGERIILKHFEHCGHFSMAAGMMPAAPPKKDHYKYTKAIRVILEAACCLPKHRVFSTSISSFL